MHVRCMWFFLCLSGCKNFKLPQIKMSSGACKLQPCPSWLWIWLCYLFLEHVIQNLFYNQVVHGGGVAFWSDLWTHAF
jgi:hypothetical protein